jgi:hypothetical protein
MRRKRIRGRGGHTRPQDTTRYYKKKPLEEEDVRGGHKDKEE